VKDASLHLVESLDDAQDFLRWLSQNRRSILAVDTETTGLNPYSDELRLVQFGDSETSYAVGAREWWQVISDALARYEHPIVFHNAKFDLHFLENAGHPIPAPHNTHDTMLMDHVSYPIRSHALKRMSYQRYGPQATVGERMLNDRYKETKTDWRTIPITDEAYWGYACMDTVLTARIADDLRTDLRSRGLWEPYEREMAVESLAYRMERNGIHIDTDYTQSLYDLWEEELICLQLQLDAYGISKPNAKRQIVQALQTAEGWDPEEFTETGEPKLDKQIMAGIDSEILPHVMRFKRLTKWRSSYLEHFLENPIQHPNIRTMGARTGRMSITEPALQTLPAENSEIRNCIIPKDGYKIHAIDYDQQELRVMAHHSGDPGMQELFRESKDPHSYFTSVIYGMPYDEARTHPKRKLSKNTVFARMYGAGAERIALTAGVHPHEIVEFMNIFDVNFPYVKRFMKDLEEKGRQRALNEGEPYIKTVGGRWLNTEVDKLYKLTNCQIQGDCADVLKMKALDLHRAGFTDNMLVFVHDEILFQFPEGDTEGPEEAARIMYDDQLFTTPLTVSHNGPADRWGDFYE